MNTLQLVVATGPERSGNYRPVDLVVDGHRLIDTLSRMEAPYASAEGTPGIAGQYSSLSFLDTFLPSRHFLRGPRPVLAHAEKVVLLVCECGCEGCWDFVCRMTFSENTVAWSDFEQVHRDWDYTELGTLVFDRKAYEAQFAQLPPD